MDEQTSPDSPLENASDVEGAENVKASHLDDTEDDVVGHRFLTPDQAQERAERARAERESDAAREGD